ncbi:MAG TPA: nuclear transport factor 2 family protein [Acidimicrobiales bacterium]|nr:nuclear transport factor 2 family protein [Acidimicrobiales bacterium]
MELWELDARESIRDLVTRYNSNGDSGRFPQVLELFAPDAVMEIVGADGETTAYRGRDEIVTVFTGARDRWGASAERRGAPAYIRHCVFTHQVDLLDRTHARGRCYFQVLMAHGLDHWGRYLDEYEMHGGRWLFSLRRVTTDGRAASGAG